MLSPGKASRVLRRFTSTSLSMVFNMKLKYLRVVQRLHPAFGIKPIPTTIRILTTNIALSIPMFSTSRGCKKDRYIPSGPGGLNGLNASIAHFIIVQQKSHDFQRNMGFACLFLLTCVFASNLCSSTLFLVFCGSINYFCLN